MYVQPVKEGHISSEYGLRTLRGKEQFHGGIDIVASSNKYIYCPVKGKVFKAGYNTSYGYRIWLEILNGEYRGSHMVLAHMSEINTYNPGDIIEQNTIVGKIGNTGLSLGEHLHLGIKKNFYLFEHPDNCINPTLIRGLYGYNS